MTELVTSGSVGGMASNGCLYPEVATHLNISFRCRKTMLILTQIITGCYARMAQ